MRNATQTLAVLPGVNARARRFALEVSNRRGARGMGYVPDTAGKIQLTAMVNALGGTGRTPSMDDVSAARAALGDADPWDDWSFLYGYDQSSTLWQKLAEAQGRALAQVGVSVAASSDAPANRAAAARAQEALNVSDSPLGLSLVLGKQAGEDVVDVGKRALAWYENRSVQIALGVMFVGLGAIAANAYFGGLARRSNGTDRGRRASLPRDNPPVRRPRSGYRARARGRDA